MGRKTLRDEAVQADVINKSWMTIRDILNSPSVDDERKAEICLEVVKKSCPKDINLNAKGLERNVYNIIGEFQRSILGSRVSKANSNPPLELASGDGVHEGRTRQDDTVQEVSE